MSEATTFPSLEDPNWVMLESGMQYWDVTVGDGPEVKPGATVTVHYCGWLTNGKKFDSSFDRGQTISFPLANVIKGWQDGVPGMKPGGIRRLLIPSEMGYGKRGAGADIPPDSTLVFTIELVKSH